MTTIENGPESRARMLAGCLLVAMTLTVYSGAPRFDFVEYDDNEYVTENPVVRAGITLKGLLWAFSTFHSANWHPLTWLSHMVDCEVWGLNPAGHHLTSVILHVANSLLLLMFLHRSTGNYWRSWLVAAFFAVHPLHVESVAWVAERKDVLSGCFWMLILLAYFSYTRTSRRANYFLVVGLYALGLMAKPMLVTLPFALLLLDYWPLRRAQHWKLLVSEKLPLFALSAFSCAVTFLAQRNIGAVVSLRHSSMGLRIENAMVSYASYLVNLVWPSDLAAYYPLRSGLSLWPVIASGLFLLMVSAWAIGRWRSRPYLLVGWLWFLGTLVPVIGLVQVGGQAMADRYTYIPLIGVLMMLAWLVPEFQTIRLRRMGLAALAVISIILIGLAHIQAGYWQNSLTLFHRALSVSGDQPILHYNLGVALAKQRRLDEAIVQYREALKRNPQYAEAYANLGDALFEQGKTAAAVESYREAVRLKPELPAACGGLGVALAVHGALDQALSYLQTAARLNPKSLEYQHNYARALAEAGRYAEAAEHYRCASLLVDPTAQPELARRIRKQVKYCESIRH